jgi:hypothetical protein
MMPPDWYHEDLFLPMPPCDAPTETPYGPGLIVTTALTLVEASIVQIGNDLYLHPEKYLPPPPPLDPWVG